MSKNILNTPPWLGSQFVIHDTRPVLTTLITDPKCETTVKLRARTEQNCELKFTLKPNESSVSEIRITEISVNQEISKYGSMTHLRLCLHSNVQKCFSALCFLTSLIPCTNGSELEVSALAEGGVGGALLRIPTVARTQMMHVGIAQARSWKRRETHIT